MKVFSGSKIRYNWFADFIILVRGFHPLQGSPIGSEINFIIGVSYLDSGTKTLLGKIVGVYKVGYKSVTGTGMKMDLLIIENLFYKKEVDKSYDLKVTQLFSAVYSCWSVSMNRHRNWDTYFIFKSPPFENYFSQVFIYMLVFILKDLFADLDKNGKNLPHND